MKKRNRFKLILKHQPIGLEGCARFFYCLINTLVYSYVSFLIFPVLPMRLFVQQLGIQGSLGFDFRKNTVLW